MRKSLSYSRRQIKLMAQCCVTHVTPLSEAAMRLLLFILGIGVGIVSIGNRAEAQNYPWCGVYRDGVMICSFTTFPQCLATRERSRVLHTKQHIPNIACTTSVY